MNLKMRIGFLAMAVVFVITVAGCQSTKEISESGSVSASGTEQWSICIGCENGLTGFTYNGVYGGKAYNEKGISGGNELQVGWIVQILSAGVDDKINPPDNNGNATGDDAIEDALVVGKDDVWHMFGHPDSDPAYTASQPGMFYHNVTKNYTVKLPKIYVRAWNAATIKDATYYNNSDLYVPAPNWSQMVNAPVPSFYTKFPKPKEIPLPKLDVPVPNKLDFVAIENGTPPLAQTFKIKNIGTVDLNWSATHNQEISWLLFSSTSGRLVPGAETTLTVTTDQTGLTASENRHVDYISISSDGGNQQVEVTLKVITGEASQPPKARDISVETYRGRPITILLDATDPDGDVLSYTIVNYPAHGALSTISGNKVTYTPIIQYIGNDSFTYKANDGKLDSNIAKVNINVKRIISRN